MTEIMRDVNHYDTNELASRLRSVASRLGRKSRYVHPKSILNFLRHLNDFKDRKKKEEIFLTIDTLLNKLENLDVAEVNSGMGAQIFDEYLRVIISHYNVYMGFWIFINWYY